DGAAVAAYSGAISVCKRLAQWQQGLQLLHTLGPVGQADLVDASNLMSFPWRWSLLLHGPRSVAVASAAVLSGCCRAGSLGARLQALQVLINLQVATERCVQEHLCKQTAVLRLESDTLASCG
ncbi:unnamed protein product, partial [Cladocopium goreaui]